MAKLKCFKSVVFVGIINFLAIEQLKKKKVLGIKRYCLHYGYYQNI